MPSQDELGNLSSYSTNAHTDTHASDVCVAPAQMPRWLSSSKVRNAAQLLEYEDLVTRVLVLHLAG